MELRLGETMVSVRDAGQVYGIIYDADLVIDVERNGMEWDVRSGRGVSSTSSHLIPT